MPFFTVVFAIFDCLRAPVIPVCELSSWVSWLHHSVLAWIRRCSWWLVPWNCCFAGWSRLGSWTCFAADGKRMNHPLYSPGLCWSSADAGHGQPCSVIWLWFWLSHAFLRWRLPACWTSLCPAWHSTVRLEGFASLFSCSWLLDFWSRKSATSGCFALSTIA